MCGPCIVLFVLHVAGASAVEVYQQENAFSTKVNLHRGLMRSEAVSSSIEFPSTALAQLEKEVPVVGEAIETKQADVDAAADAAADAAVDAGQDVIDADAAADAAANAAIDKEFEQEDEDTDRLIVTNKTCCGKTTATQVTLVAQIKDADEVAKTANRLKKDAADLAGDEKSKLKQQGQVKVLESVKKSSPAPCPYGRGGSLIGCSGRLQTQAKLYNADRAVMLDKMNVKGDTLTLQQATNEALADRKFKPDLGKVKVSKNHKWAGPPSRGNMLQAEKLLRIAKKLAKDAQTLTDANLAKLTDASGCGNASAALKKAATEDDKAVDKGAVKVDDDIDKLAKIAASGPGTHAVPKKALDQLTHENTLAQIATLEAS